MLGYGCSYMGSLQLSTATVTNVDSGSNPRDRIVSTVVGAIVILGALFNGAVGALSLLSPASFLATVGHAAQEVTPGVLLFAAYASARELAIAAALLGLLVVRAAHPLIGVLLVAALANAIDAAGAVAAQRWAQLLGAVVFGVAYACAAMWFSRATSRSSYPG